MPLKPKLHVVYQGSAGRVDWLGQIFGSREAFLAYMKGPVRARYLDEEQGQGGNQEEPAEGPNRGDVPSIQKLRLRIANPWMVAQSLAECVLADDPELGAVWPTNVAREQSTPYAFPAGPDALGFCRVKGEICFAICEFKSSSEADSPPTVVRGPTGLLSQLQKYAYDSDALEVAVGWLGRRCNTPEFKDLLKAAVAQYNPVSGMNILLAGVLIRDTEPRSTDVVQAAKMLAQSLGERMQGTLRAIHVPVPLSGLPVLIRSDQSWKQYKIS